MVAFSILEWRVQVRFRVRPCLAAVFCFVARFELVIP